MAAESDRAAPAAQPYLSGFSAFVLMQKPGYDLYALARLGDPGLSEDAVRLALRRTAGQWGGVLLQRRPVACAWRTLREVVSVACLHAPNPTADRLNQLLPAGLADVELLHRLGLSVAQSARLMGRETAETAADLLMARRRLAVADPKENPIQDR
ncbi:hypothetical protein ABZW10_31285 [Kitasatospora sp. NPDC004723]|uniref:hypothetical protein n=1 Tax=Kitasatospora sp. NPDC004723 TaxID=3154288 RepID=UPI0033B4C65F